MWKKTFELYHLRPLSANTLILSQVRHINNAEIAPRYRRVSKAGWFRRRGSRLLYPTSNPPLMRQLGEDKTLQERLDEMFLEERNESLSKAKDIGFPFKESKPLSSKEITEWRKKQRSSKELAKAARLNQLNINLEDVQSEHEKIGGYALEVQNAAELYGIYEDLFDGAHFTPNLSLTVEYGEDLITPVYRGNVVKPKEATKAPQVSFESGPDSLWTLILTNPDGHFTENNTEYLHWMVTNIKGNELKSGSEIAPYLQPFPPFGTGFHRFVFILFKQEQEIDGSKYIQKSNADLTNRSFKTLSFFEENKDNITPSGLAFFQSDWDSTLTKFYHEVLEMKEPRYEYDFPPYYTSPWKEKSLRYHYKGFNYFLDTQREPKEIQEEVLRKKLNLTHPFKGQLDTHIEFPNLHRPSIKDYRDRAKYGSWRVREIERERLRQGIYQDMDWTHLRRDPSIS